MEIDSGATVTYRPSGVSNKTEPSIATVQINERNRGIYIMKMPEHCAYDLLINLYPMAYDLEAKSPILFLRFGPSEKVFWQETVDILYRMIKCGLFELMYLPDDFDGNYQWFFDDISQNDPFAKGSNEWHIRQCYTTDKCNELVKKYIPDDWDEEEIHVGLIEEIERIFEEAGVPWGESFIKIKPNES